METILVMLIVGAALVWAVRRIVTLFSKNPSANCGCSCDGCPAPGEDSQDNNSGAVEIGDMRPKE